MISEPNVEIIREFFSSDYIDNEWFARHMKISFEDISHSITVTVDNINEQEYETLNKQKTRDTYL